MALRQRDRRLEMIGHLLHVRTGHLHKVHFRQGRVTEGQHRRAYLQLAVLARLHQIVELDQRVAQPPDGRLRYAGDLRDLRSSEPRSLGVEATHDVEAARQRRNEMSVGLHRKRL
jgi:hypothetical protein